MNEERSSSRWGRIGLVAVLVLALAGACGGDDDSSDPSAGDAADQSSSADDDGSGNGGSNDDGSGEDDELEIAGALGDDDLFVSREYLQGEWCDDEGNSYSIDGDIAVIEDGSGGVAEFPIDLLFMEIAGIEVEQSDNEFALTDGESAQTFTRGSC